jgi:hypothetical protein
MSVEGVAMEMGETMTDAIRRANSPRIERMPMNGTDTFTVSREEIVRGLRTLRNEGEIGRCEAALAAKNVHNVDVRIQKLEDKIIVGTKFKDRSGANVGNTIRVYRKSR